MYKCIDFQITRHNGEKVNHNTGALLILLSALPACILMHSIYLQVAAGLVTITCCKTEKSEAS